MKPYALQMRKSPWSKTWEVVREFDTLDEACTAYAQLPFKSDYRIAESYTVVRYKAVKNVSLPQQD